MDHRERNFWDRIRPHLSRKVFAKRIENGVSTGDPDVFLMRQGRVVWVELKFCMQPSRKTSMLLGKNNVRQEQVNWHLAYANRGGTSYILIGTSSGMDYLMPGAIADKLNEMSCDEIEANAVGTYKGCGKFIEEALWPNET